MDAFHRARSETIDTPYVDGISVTYASPRKHIWTFAVGLSTVIAPPHQPSNCPCAERKGIDPPSFVGSDYYCESGNPSTSWDGWYLANRLWDGSCANTKSKCCDHPGMPYFIRHLPLTSSEPLEVRLCTDQDTGDENVGIEKLKLFIRWVLQEITDSSKLIERQTCWVRHHPIVIVSPSFLWLKPEKKNQDSTKLDSTG